jgi:glycoside/pentoside/hexuronide:cation symporter, GPH family
MPPIIEERSAEEKRMKHVDVPTSKRILWGMGGFSDAIVTHALISNVALIYVNALGFGPALVSMACAVPRLFDAVSDPVVGYLSDNTRSRWGRRRPWMLVGLILIALLGTMIWRPPVAPATGWNWPLFIYLSVMMSLLYAVGYTFFNIPHIAMGYEMTTNYNERTHLFKWRQMFFAAAGFITPWFLWLCNWFEGPESTTRGSEGVLIVSVIFAGSILLMGLPSVFFCREKVQLHLNESKVKFMDAVKLTLRNRPFWLVVVSNFISKFCMMVTGMFFVYIFLYHIGRGDQKQGAFFMGVFFFAINFATLGAMAPIASLTDRLGKKVSLLLMLVMSAVAYFSLWFTFTNADGAFFSVTMPWGAEVSMQWPCLITAALIGIFTNTIPMINNSMLADVCDLDELKSGHRREAFYGAVYTTIDKFAMAVALALQGYLLVASGFDSTLEFQTPETVRFWMLGLIISQPVGFLIAFIAILFYPLTRARCHEIRSQLDARAQGGTATEPLRIG